MNLKSTDGAITKRVSDVERTGAFGNNQIVSLAGTGSFATKICRNERV